MVVRKREWNRNSRVLANGAYATEDAASLAKARQGSRIREMERVAGAQAAQEYIDREIRTIAIVIKTSTFLRC